MVSTTSLTDLELYLFGEGTYGRAYEKLGAHPGFLDGNPGVWFAVWAPNAEEVSVAGDFNGWQPGKHRLLPVGDSGVWRGFVEGLRPGDLYKYALRPRGQLSWLQKADPYAFAAEMRPATASVVAGLDSYSWGDEAWLRRRSQRDWAAQPISVYEVHLGSWRRDPEQPNRFLSYRELAAQLPAYVESIGFSHVEFLPVSEHPLDMSWGYQVTGYFAPTSRFGSPTDFMALVDALHQRGLGVIVDWVPAHFPKDAHALARFDSTHLYEHMDPRQGEHPDWGTFIFNYGRGEVRSFLLSNALFWLDRYHIDGLRVDAVASMLYLDYSREPGQWIPNKYGGRENLEAVSLLQSVNQAVHQEYPGVLTIAEESTAWPGVTGAVNEGGLGFDLKWNMGWMHDTLQYMEQDPIHRRFHQDELTFSLVYAFSERFILPLSHDEVVHGKRSLLSKMPGDEWQKFANLRLLYGYMFGHPGKKLLFMGSELGQWAEWNYAGSLDWRLLELDGVTGDRHRGLHRLLNDLQRMYRQYTALYAPDFDPKGFEWIDAADAENSVIAFQRLSPVGTTSLVFVCNFTPVIRQGYRIGLPHEGTYRTILDTDDVIYGGSGTASSQTMQAEPVAWHGRTWSTELTLPPLAVVIFSRD